jgi:hypothetical protein
VYSYDDHSRQKRFFGTDQLDNQARANCQKPAYEAERHGFCLLHTHSYRTGNPDAATLRADETYYGLIVHGGGTTQTSYEAGILRVEFRHASHPAGGSLSYERQVPRGTAAWPDRLMSPQEPSVLLQKMPAADAMNLRPPTRRIYVAGAKTAIRCAHLELWQ